MNGGQVTQSVPLNSAEPKAKLCSGRGWRLQRVIEAVLQDDLLQQLHDPLEIEVVVDGDRLHGALSGQVEWAHAVEVIGQVDAGGGGRTVKISMTI